jgi:hypothetical protein
MTLNGPSMSLAEELSSLARSIGNAASSSDQEMVQGHIKSGLILLARLNKAYATRCIEAGEASAQVVQRKLKHEAESIAYQNKKCALCALDIETSSSPRKFMTCRVKVSINAGIIHLDSCVTLQCALLPLRSNSV